MEGNKPKNIEVSKIVIGLIAISVFSISIYNSSINLTNTIGLIWGLILLMQSNIFHRIDTSNLSINRKKRFFFIWILIILFLILFIKNNFI